MATSKTPGSKRSLRDMIWMNDNLLDVLSGRQDLDSVQWPRYLQVRRVECAISPPADVSSRTLLRF